MVGVEGLLSAVRRSSPPREELRFGTVLNGGVSLAVWMGGTVHELDRLTKARERGAPGDPYRALLDLAGGTARVDVLAGTSAGGINGAALALAQVNRDADLSMLRSLWIERGRIESLLRRPFSGSPTSLLQGDEYFLPALNEAMTMLAREGGHVDAHRAPIDLTITTTVLGGNQTVSLDSMGQPLPQTVHAGRFRWQRSTRQAPADDPFAPTNAEVTAARLALASRSTASFPFAFEPAFVPVRSSAFPVGRPGAPGDAPTEDQRLRPDMHPVVRSWGTFSEKDRSRFVIDGGVLANTPTIDLLQAIEGMEAAGPVRRVVLLVYPHAPAPGSDPASTFEKPPTSVAALSGMLGALTGQGGRTYVDRVEEHNRRAAGRRGTRSDVLHASTPVELLELADQLYPHYQLLRVRRAGRDLAARLSGNVDDGTTSAALPSGWSYDRVRVAAEQAQQRWIDVHGALPYVPAELPVAADAHGWQWGVSGALGVTEAASELLRQVVAALREDGPDYDRVTAARQTVFALRNSIEVLRQAVDGAWRTDVGDGRDDAVASLAPDGSYWSLRLTYYDHLMVGDRSWDDVADGVATVGDAAAAAAPDAVDPDARRSEVVEALTQRLRDNARRASPDDDAPGVVGRQLDLLVGAVLTEVHRALDPLDPAVLDEASAAASEVARWWAGLGLAERPSAAVLLVRLLHLEVVATSLGDEVTTGSTLPVELVQLSAQTPNAFARHSRTADDKLGGWSIARFSGFLKRSWRANDWTWGRVDAATVLSRTVLHPGRVRRAARLSGYLEVGTAEERARATVAELLTELHGGPRPELDALVREAEAELAVVLADVVPGDPVSTADLPASLPALADLVARAVHEQVVAEELPEIAAAIRADRVEGGHQRSHGEVLLATHGSLIARLEDVRRAGTGPDPAPTAAPGAAPSPPSPPPPPPLTPAERALALGVFDAAGVGRESLREEATSDASLRTASTAAAVIATVTSSPRSGLRAFAKLTKAFRGLVLLPYWVVTGLTSKGGSIARGLALLALAVGATVLALSLFGALPETLSGPATAAGAGAVLVALGYAALRTGTLLHGVVLLSPLIPLLTYAVVQVRTDRADGGTGAGLEEDAAAQGGTTLAVVVALALVLVLLGSFGASYASVWTTLDRLADRRGVPRTRPTWRRRAEGLLRSLLPLALGAVVLALLVALVVSAIRVDWVTRLEEAGWSTAATWALVGGALVLLAVLGGVVATIAGTSLRALAPVSQALPPDAPPAASRFQLVSNPRGVAVGWSVVYGIGYAVVTLLLLVGMVGDHTQLWHRTAVVTATTFTLALLVVVPLVLPVLEYLDLRRSEGLRAETVAVPDDYAADLVARGLGYRLLVTAGPPPQLTWLGRKLRDAALRSRTAAASQ